MDINETNSDSLVTKRLWVNYDCDFDEGPASKAAIGLIVLSNDQSVEGELRAFFPSEGVGLYVNRIPFPTQVSIEAAQEMANKITEVASLIVPDDQLDVIALCTTGGTMAIGEERLFELLSAGRPGIKYTSPITAAIEGLKTLNAVRLALLTPYPLDINETLIQNYIENAGFKIVSAGCFNLEGDREYIRVPPQRIKEVVLELDRDDVDAVFVSCTALRVSPVIVELEELIGKPVISSNQALAWHCLRLAGCKDPVYDRGSLLQR